MVNTLWHEYPYNFTGLDGTLTNVTGIGSYFTYLNVVGVNGFMGYIILALSGIVSFIVLKSMVSFEKAIAATMFFLTLLSIIMFRIQWINMGVMIIIIVITVVTILLVRQESSKYGL